MSIDWKKYDPGECYDEIISTPGYARAAARNLPWSGVTASGLWL